MIDVESDEKNYAHVKIKHSKVVAIIYFQTNIGRANPL